MKAYIMAGGKGTRLSSITNDEIPKPMAVICGKPILQWTIERLKQSGVTEIFISVSHLAHKITEYFKDGSDFGVKIVYITEDQPLGSAGAIYYIKDRVDSDFIICSGDVVFDIDISRMMKYHKNNNAIITLFTHPNSHPYDSDIVLSDLDGRVTDIVFKNVERDYYYKNQVNAGFFVVNPKALKYFKELKKINMEHDFIYSLIKEGKRVFAYQSPEYIRDVGTTERFTKAIVDIQTNLVERKNLKNKQRAICVDVNDLINDSLELFATNKDKDLSEACFEAVKNINLSEFLIILVDLDGSNNKGNIVTAYNKIETLLGTRGVFIDGRYVFAPTENFRLKQEFKNWLVNTYNVDLKESFVFTKGALLGNIDGDFVEINKVKLEEIKPNTL